VTEPTSPGGATPRVSVALCTHNGARFIGEQIRSILEQTRPVDELVVGDDASTDGTIDLVERAIRALGTSAPSLVVLRNALPLGVRGNFEATLSATTGDIVLLSDQDDVWHPERVERTLAAFERLPGVGLVHTDARLIDEQGDDLGTTLFEGLSLGRDDLRREHEGDGFGLLMTRNVATGATIGLRASLLAVALPIPPEWLHDEWLAAIAGATGRLDVVEEELLGYRQHSSNVIGVNPLDARGKWAKLVQHRGDRNLKLAARALALVRRLESMDGIDPRVLDAARGKLAHEQRRAALPGNRLLRLPSIVAECSRRGYSRYGRGAADIARDLVQPL
jgi:glycosyltransferase involved in cell wall biosynthesis